MTLEILQQLESHPQQKVAIVDNRGHLTYGQLNSQANQVAHVLQGLGVGPDDLVGVYMPRGADMVTACLGVWKSGAAYVPIDVRYPSDRLKAVLANVKVVLVSSEYIMAAQKYVPFERPILIVSEVCQHLIFDTSPPSPVSAENLAYVIYTSGSTGKPKGVMIEHGSIQLRIAWYIETFQLDNQSNMIQVASPAFDVSMLEIWPCLVAGGTLHIPDGKIIPDPALLRDYIDSHNIDTAFFPTPLGEAFIKLPTPPRKLRIFQVAGDRLHPVQQQLPYRLYNLYGPTEVTVLATGCEVPAPSDGSPPIGLPLPGVLAYVLDDNMQPVADGEIGELYLGGDTLARGYYGQPELTAEWFISDPFGPPESRCYRTGDLVRRQPDGNLEFIGRADFQVKISGYRIELGEIEAVISRHPDVNEVVVVAYQDEVRHFLVAYVATSNPANADLLHGLQKSLKEHLPSYMIPHNIVVLDMLPHTSSGKVDRRNLPSPVKQDASPAHMTDVEAQVASIFQQVLGLNFLPAPHQSFLYYGGSSLLAMAVVVRLADLFGVEIPLRLVMEDGTVSGIANWLGEHDTRTKRKGELQSPSHHLEPGNGLTWFQHGMWMLEHLYPDTPVYNVVADVDLGGDVDTPRLERAFRSVIGRHIVYGSRFGTGQEDWAVQYVIPEAQLPELSFATAHSIEPFVKGFTQRPFNLTDGPLLRACVLRLEAGNTKRLLLVCHHMICDQASIALLLEEVARVYDNVSLPPVKLQYSDYTSWKPGIAQVEEVINYWRNHLQPTTLFPTKRHSLNGGKLFVNTSGRLLEQTRVIARQYDTTPFVVLLACYLTFLHRYTQQEHITVGVPFSSRNTRSHAVHGNLVNTLPIGLNLQASMTFGDVVREVRRVTLDVQEYREIPFDLVVSQTGHALTDIFQTLFAYQEPISLTVGGRQCPVAVDRVDVGTSKMPVALYAEPTKMGLQIALNYSTELFATAEEAQSFLERFVSFLEAVIHTPDQSITAPSLLLPDEVLFWQKANSASFPSPDICLHTWIEEQAAKYPDRVALQVGDHMITYQEMNERANALAHTLAPYVTRPEDRVAVCASRSPEFVIGLLAILKTGAAYVPIDPTYPTERIASLFNLADVAAVLAETHIQTNLPVICLDTKERLPLFSSAAPDRNTKNVSYIIFTSGSTGEPKGVMIEHHAIVNYVTAVTRRFRLDKCRSFAMVSTVAADLGHTVLFPALCTGGTLHLVPQNVATNGPLMAAYIQQHQVDCIKIVPSHLQALHDDAGEMFLPQKALILGGESPQPGWLRDVHVQAQTVGCAIHNHYGPTETTVGVLTHTPYNKPAMDSPFPLGLPLDNTQAYVLDKNLQPVPPGAHGELYIGGSGVARGYLNRPDLTAERFIPNPFMPSGSRLYRTGDVVYWTAKTGIVFVGRVDDQVKVRGFRVELGEVAAGLRAYPNVAASQVIASNGRLVGFIVSPDEIDVEKAKAFLRTRLPDYMVPATIIWLRQLPLTTNGKVDKQLLLTHLAATKADNANGREYTPTEQRVLSIVADLLNTTEGFGPNENFFDLGGHSLAAVRLVGRVRSQFGVEITLKDIFSTPVLTDLAALIDEKPKATAITPIVRRKR